MNKVTLTYIHNCKQKLANNTHHD